ncbi:FAD-binding protein [Alcaligenaceae bacterium]|nr:FAD-binding protein [Alcaligenaceae bacterium]
MTTTSPFDSTYDLIVLGSGCAALTAALRAATAGLSVLICEKTSLLGGTSAMSAGGIWVPANHLAQRAGLEDNLDDALRYIAGATPEGWDETPSWKAMLAAGPPMLELIETHTPLRFRLTNEPDPFPAVPGSRPKGRMLSPLPLSRLAAGRFAFRVRGSTLPEPFTYHEVLETDLYHRPLSTTFKLLPRLIKRTLTLSAGKGVALMTGLVRGCVDAGCQIVRQARSTELLLEHGRVTGAKIEWRGRSYEAKATHGVLIATGGFEWNPEMMDQYLPGPLAFLGGPRSLTGDGQLMAARAGAELSRMDQATFTPAIPKRYRGAVHGMPVPYHGEANVILINQHGQRFTDELVSNIGELINRRDPETGQMLHLPAHVVTDASYLPKMPLIRLLQRLSPGWLTKAPTIEALATKIGIEPDALAATVARYNALCATGVDSDFGRGSTKAQQAADKRKSGGLAPIVKPPFVAIRFNRSIMSTKGGPRTDEHGRALRADGSVIEGLYCAGASMANPLGTRGISPGTTLGPFMSWGYLCADDIVRRAAQTAQAKPIT